MIKNKNKSRDNQYSYDIQKTARVNIKKAVYIS